MPSGRLSTGCSGPAAKATPRLSGGSELFKLACRMYAYRFGFTYTLPHLPVFVDLSDVGDRDDVITAGPSDALHNALFMGAGLKF
jgi:hypothetical protein